MKLQIASLLLVPLVASAASHVVSGTASRLPMSLSTVITDLEAEGATKLTTAAFLTSRSITPSSRSSLVRSLFGITGAGEHDEEIQDGVTTAFGKKMDEGEGVAVANPLPGTAVGEVASTVVACGGTVVYAVSTLDVNRGEGLFDTLAPAVERLLAHRAEVDEAPENRPASLVVVVAGAQSDAEVAAAKSKLEREAATMLGSIVQPRNGKKAVVLSDVFDGIEFVSDRDGAVDGILSGVNGSCEPADAAKSVSNVVTSGVMLELKGKSPEMHKLTDPIDLAAARRLGPAARKALDSALATVRDVVGSYSGTEEGADTQLVSNFGELVDAAVKRAVEQFDSDAGPTLLKTSKVAKRIRSDLLEQMYAELSDLYEAQLKELRLASFESFKRGLSKLRVSPNLDTDMDKVYSDSVKEFAAAAKKLKPKGSAVSSWPSADAAKSELRKTLREYSTERLQLARSSGQYRPAPRKGVTVGFHWLFPKPFGNDYRQEPWDVHAKQDLVYIPKDKITDVSPDDVRTGDWRRNVVPSPAGNEMIYMQ